MTASDNVITAVEQLTGPVFRLIHRIVRDRDEALDLTQDVLVRVLREQPRLRDPERLKPYVLRAGYNAALNARRNRSRRSRLHNEIQRSTSDRYSSGSADPFESRETRKVIAQAMTNLSDKQREAVSLRFFGNLSTAETASAMKITEGSVKVHLARGLRNLQALLAPLRNKEDI